MSNSSGIRSHEALTTSDVVMEIWWLLKKIPGSRIVGGILSKSSGQVASSRIKSFKLKLLKSVVVACKVPPKDYP